MNLYIYSKTSKYFFSNIPSDLNNLDEYLLPIKDFLKENSRFGDVVLIQGDFGAVYHMVNFSKNLGLKSVYATTNRVIEEILVDEKTIKKSIFEHVMFRRYI
ncbi:CRISPR-associated protein Csx20 [Aliarcobacter cryaerophilus]